MKQKTFKINKTSLKKLKYNYLKNKLISNLLKKGKKATGEKIILKSFKALQKKFTKQSKKLIQLSIISSLPTLKVNKIENKKQKKTKKIKEIPFFIANKTSKISLSIKYILKTLQNKKINFFTKFAQEIIQNSTFKGNSITLKNELQKQSLIKKHYLINLRHK